MQREPVSACIAKAEGGLTKAQIAHFSTQGSVSPGVLRLRHWDERSIASEDKIAKNQGDNTEFTHQISRQERPK